jgi:hypothetical protein
MTVEGSNPELLAAAAEFFVAHDAATTEVERQELQAAYVRRWRIFPVRVEPDQEEG